MSSKTYWFAGAVASLAIPYFSLDGNLPQTWHNARSQWLGNGTEANVSAQVAMGDASTNEPWHWPQWMQSAEQPPNPSQGFTQSITTVVPLAEAMQQELTPQWVMARWPQAMVASRHSSEIVLRVPLITGYEPYAVTGSLTYTFNGQQQLTRMAFTGQTNEESVLLATLLPVFGLQMQHATHGQLFLNYHEREPLSMLHIEPAHAELGKRVLLELNRPLPGATMSSEMRQFVKQLAG